MVRGWRASCVLPGGGRPTPASGAASRARAAPTFSPAGERRLRLRRGGWCRLWPSPSRWRRRDRLARCPCLCFHDHGPSDCTVRGCGFEHGVRLVRRWVSRQLHEGLQGFQALLPQLRVVALAHATACHSTPRSHTPPTHICWDTVGHTVSGRCTPTASDNDR